MIEVKLDDEVDELDYPTRCPARWSQENKHLMQLETDIVKAIAKKLDLRECGVSIYGDLVSDHNCEMTDLIGDYGSLFRGCVVSRYCNSLQFYGAFCESLSKFDEIVYLTDEAKLDESVENCRKYIIRSLYSQLASSVFMEVKKDANYARYVPAVACEPELFIKFDTADEMAGWICDKMNDSMVQTKKLISELYKRAKRKQLKAEKLDAA